MATRIEHRPAEQLFEATVEGQHGRIEYRVDEGVMTIEHTEVDRALEGHGVAGALVRAALDYARAAGLKVVPECAYTRAYMERHPQTLDLRA
ncbi:MAG: N-acetyltransferase [Rhizobacter sp.]|nr:N-acetyltransferase [Rhizobacter sp.]